MSSHEPIVWLNGFLLPAREARLSPFDRGFTVGEGVFETMRARDGLVFAPSRHWRRLVGACENFGILPPPKDVFFDAMQHTLNASRLRDARVRFTVTSGEPGVTREARTMLCTAQPVPLRAEVETVTVCPWPRNERSALSGTKSISYGENCIALAYAKRTGAGEAILGNTRGQLCEGATSNIFLVQDGELHTPSLDSGCLNGVMRGLVIELCRTEGLPIHEAALPLHALADSSEAFLTSSIREVHSISQVDGKTLSNVVGPLTKRVEELVRRLVCENTDP